MIKDKDHNRKKKIVRAMVNQGGESTLRKIHELAGGETYRSNTYNILKKMHNLGKVGKNGNGRKKGSNPANVTYYLTETGWKYAIYIGEANFIPPEYKTT